MTFKFVLSRVRVLSIFGWAAGLGLCAPLAAQTDTAAGGDELQEVTITGSRLQSAGFNAPTPVTEVSAQTIEERAPANLSDVLLQQPALRIQNGDTSRQGSGGTNANPLPQGQIVAPNLRNLGNNRTLVLLNGHRVVPAEWDGLVDINMVPVGMVDRIDIVTGGASAAYGADAVAGVTNIILRDKMEGIKFGGQMGVTQYGTGKQYTGNLSGGTSSLMEGRLHLIGGVDVNRTDAITSVYGKSWGAAEIGNFSGANNSLTSYRVVNNAPATVITTNVEPASTAPGGLWVSPSGTAYTFDANGNPVVFTRGTVSANNQLMIGSTSNYGHNLNDQVYLRDANSRFDFMGRASYDFTDKMNGYIEVNQSRNLSFPFLGGEFNQSSAIAGNSPGIVVSRTNPYVTPALLALMGNASTINMGRIDTELSYGGISGNAARQDATVRRFAVGLTGNFAETWTYDLYAQRGRAWTLLQRNDYSAWALQKAVNGCATPVVGSPGFTNQSQVNTAAAYESLTGKTCAPLDPFGVGNISQAAINYIQNQSYSDQHMGQDVASADFSGKPLHLPAGDLGVAFGLDWRQEFLEAPVDPASTAGSGFNALVPPPLANTVAADFGHYHVQEGYAEVGAPVVKDKFLVKSLDLNAAGRITRYELAGTVRTWKLGATWDPIDSLRLRITKSHDIRQGNMVELFRNGGPNNTNFDTTQLLVGTVGANGTVYDPAANKNAAGQDINPVGKASANAGAQVGGGLSVGGVANPHLRPEIANTDTGGVVWTRGGFSASIDYYYIDIRDVIGNLSSQQAINNCIAGDQSFCKDITFTQDPSVASGILIIGVPNDNLNRLNVQGFDFEMGYNGLVGPGRLAVRTLMNYQPHNQQTTFSTGQTVEMADTLGSQPKFAYNVTFNYSVGRWTPNLQIRGFGQLRGNNITYNADGSINSGTTLGPEDGWAYAQRVAAASAVIVNGVTVAPAGSVAASSGTISKNRWPGAYYVNGGLAFKATSNTEVYLNVDNLLNKQPPALALNASLYDLLGRTFRFGVRGTF